MQYDEAALAQHSSHLSNVKICAPLCWEAQLKGKERTVEVLARAWAVGSTCLCPDLSRLNVRMCVPSKGDYIGQLGLYTMTLF